MGVHQLLLLWKVDVSGEMLNTSNNTSGLLTAKSAPTMALQGCCSLWHALLHACGLPCKQPCSGVYTLNTDLTSFGMNACDSWCDCSSWMPASLGPLLLTWVSLRSIGCSLALSYCYYRSNTGYCSISRQADSNLRYKWQRSKCKIKARHLTHAAETHHTQCTCRGCICSIKHCIQPGTLPSSANQCILGSVYLRSIERKRCIVVCLHVCAECGIAD